MIRIQPFRADLTHSEGSCTIDVAGEIDESARRDLGPIIDVAIDSFESVVIDLTHVDFIDSAGVELCLEAQVRSGTSGTGFGVVSGHPSVMAPFDILGARNRLSWRDGRVGAR